MEEMSWPIPRCRLWTSTSCCSNSKYPASMSTRSWKRGARTSRRSATANRHAYEGMQLLAQRQAEMLREAMAEWQAATQQMMSAQNPNAGAAKQAELGKQALEKALANMRELAEMATKSQTQAWEIVNRRFHENLEELKQLMQPKQ